MRPVYHIICCCKRETLISLVSGGFSVQLAAEIARCRSDEEAVLNYGQINELPCSLRAVIHSGTGSRWRLIPWERPPTDVPFQVNLCEMKIAWKLEVEKSSVQDLFFHRFLSWK